MTAAKNSKLALAFILITVLIDIIGLGIIIPVLPHLIEDLTGGTVAEAAVYGGFLLFVYALMQFVFSPILGNLSDRFGRRPVLLFSLLGLTLDYILMGFAPTIAWLFVGRVLSGIMGAAVSTATAYIADISTREKRAQNFGLIGAAFGAGFIIGPVIGGQLGEFGPRVPFFAAAVLAFVNLVYGYFVLPESLTMRKRRRFEIKRANPLGTLMSLRKYPYVLSFIAVLFFFSLAAQTYPSIWNFFTIERFEWSPSQVGYSLGAFGVMFAIVQAAVIRPSMRYLGEVKTVLVGMSFAVFAFFGMAFIDTPMGLYFFLAMGAMGGLVVPGLTGLMANRVDDNAQGELQGGINAINSITSIIGPLAATQLFSYFTTSPKAFTYFPGVPFFAAGIAVTFGAIWFTYTAIKAGLLFRRKQLFGQQTTTKEPDE
ncbi:tetracycline resistance protein, class [Maritalea myrionectae]|uniref:Tetracycline resistance protein, class n=1 Tax=Maritalea myrionectae TaxID=454601 RepID=A0A2R4MDR5_9HYPH|nr:TCR/Tet family MFS transporter [Maritalea myrionectae]AVX04152.1 tetracycline resistance protein, class [Maritalea myrionectae]